MGEQALGWALGNEWDTMLGGALLWFCRGPATLLAIVMFCMSVRRGSFLDTLGAKALCCCNSPGCSTMRRAKLPVFFALPTYVGEWIWHEVTVPLEMS